MNSCGAIVPEYFVKTVILNDALASVLRERIP